MKRVDRSPKYDSYDDYCSDESTYYPSVTTCTDTSEAKTSDLQCNLVSKLAPSGTKVETLPIGHRCLSLKTYDLRNQAVYRTKKQELFRNDTRKSKSNISSLSPEVEINLTCVYKEKPSFSGKVYPRIFTTNANSSKKLHSGSSVSMGSEPVTLRPQNRDLIVKPNWIFQRLK
ncbi:hypothetical protein AVEN_269250-1 [Araneus ventricosus]|uniref:Uncharacterized protein n=1 Tax=Araneus ventricosus TaxID=182803 RepID=A0A4Y2U0V5_ARAVE|nr:hypothetical protein AVEN_269250-1 [Araneus ventricosus]